METKRYLVVAYEGNTYYQEPDDKMNTSVPLVCAKRWECSEREDALRRARLEGVKVELWVFEGDEPSQCLNIDVRENTNLTA